MPRTRLRTINAKGLALGVGLVIALPTLAAGAVVPTGASRKPAAATSGVLPRAAGRLTRVIVLLRDDATGLAARSRARTTAVLHEELPIAAMLASAGAALVTQGKSIPYLSLIHI